MATIFKLNYDKSVTCTRRETNRKGESNADTINVLLPEKFSGIDMCQSSVIVKFNLPNGTVFTKVFERHREIYKGYIVFSIPLTSDITGEIGKINLNIFITNGYFKLINNDNYITII